ncbi:MAG: response regulator [Desulfovermiculus sp.]|nr:response regulator [Desulfovermiculus sp.]
MNRYPWSLLRSLSWQGGLPVCLFIFLILGIISSFMGASHQKALHQAFLEEMSLLVDTGGSHKYNKSTETWVSNGQIDVLHAGLQNMIHADLRSFSIAQLTLLSIIFAQLVIIIFTSRRFFRERDKAREVTQAQKEELRLNAQALRHLFDNAPIGIFRTDSSGQLLEANPAMVKMLRLDSASKKRIYSQNLDHVLYVEPAKRDELIKRLEAEKYVEQFEFQGRMEDGTWAWFSLNAMLSERPSRNQPFIIDGFVSEITQRRQALENVEHLNQVLRAIRNINQLIITEKDRSQLIHKGCQILVQSRGFEAAMIILTDQAQQPVMYAQDGLSDAFADFGRYLEQGHLPKCCQQAMGTRDVCLINKPSPTCQACHLVHNCVHRDTLCIALQYMDNVYGFLTVVIPLGQGGNQEEQSLLHELAADIAFALHGLELEKQRHAVEEEKQMAEKQLAQAQKMEAIGRLAGGVAHDFNNMLGVIMGYADMALAGMERTDSLHYPLEQIKQAAQRSADLTRQLLAFSRKQLSQPQVLDLNQEVENQRIMLARLIGENIKLKFLPADELWPIKVDPSQIDQVLANLVINARDAISDVGSITLETVNVTLDTAYANAHLYVSPGEYVCLMISDTGSGMDRKTQEQIFDPFFTTKQGEQGTGLGLSTVYGIVKQNNGIIHVYSELGKGTTFKLYFPRTQDPVRKTEPRRKHRPTQGQETVLLVEDEKMVMELTQTVLEEQGYTVLSARSPQQALDLTQKHTGRIHVLLTDLILPEMNGKELKSAIERLRPDIKTLFMSGYTEDVIVQQAMVEPQFFFIQKPFSAAGLTDKIREVLAS